MESKLFSLKWANNSFINQAVYTASAISIIEDCAMGAPAPRPHPASPPASLSTMFTGTNAGKLSDAEKLVSLRCGPHFLIWA
jgi:hypothetical protein